MRSRAKILGHPVHQVLVVFPLGMLALAAGCDVVGLATKQKRWFGTGSTALSAGLVGALAAAPFGLVDWLAIPHNTRAKRVGAAHGIGNLLVTGLFAASWLVRRSSPKKRSLATSLSVTGMALASVTAWLGGELVDRLGVGVDEPTSFDAPSSIREAPIAGAVGRALVSAAHQAATINP